MFSPQTYPLLSGNKNSQEQKREGKTGGDQEKKEGKRCSMVMRLTHDIRITMNKNDAFDFPCIIFINCDGNTNTQHLDEINC